LFRKSETAHALQFFKTKKLTTKIKTKLHSKNTKIKKQNRKWNKKNTHNKVLAKKQKPKRNVRKELKRVERDSSCLAAGIVMEPLRTMVQVQGGCRKPNGVQHSQLTTWTRTLLALCG